MNNKVEDELIEITVKETEKVYKDLVEYFDNIKKDHPDTNPIEVLMRWSCEHIAKINITLMLQQDLIERLTEQIEGDRIGLIPKSQIN